MHKRQAMRHAAAMILKGKTEVGDRVYPNRPTPLFESDLPAICVYTLSEDVDEALSSSAPRSYMRRCRLVTEIIVQAHSDCDELIDTISEQVEDVLFDNRLLCDPRNGEETLDGYLEMSGSEMALADDGRQVVMSNKITWLAPYETPTYHRDTIDVRDDFVTADAHYETAANRSGPEAEDTFDVRGA